ncbi:DNA replication and repair protein RecF [Lysobacter sp. OAE881]|uniref:DNA replication/repair protein RecF n=1 Tax=Lysobacter sp. OAE881 TaxID=2663813 RepID=UPI00178A4B31
MHVTRLELRHLRRFQDLRLDPAPGLNLITGDNGAGKTTVLEALHLMAYGRSFRGRVRDGLIRAGDAGLEVFVEWQERAGRSGDDERLRKAGLRHTGQDWTGRLDGANVAQLGDLCAALAVVTFEPGSHALITGGGESRRRYLDWGLFHVEPDFLPVWRRYSRALKQRNALLKVRARDAQLDAWDHELAEAGEPLSRFRERYLDLLQVRFEPLLSDLAPALGLSRLEYAPGWRRDEMSLADAFLLSRERDLVAGYTGVGPHRADWRVVFANLPGREALSRGQSKLTALAALLAQAEHHDETHGEWPVVALDDLASELDRHHQGRVLARLQSSGAQVFITGTEAPPGVPTDFPVHRFHVEHGAITTTC